MALEDELPGDSRRILHGEVKSRLDAGILKKPHIFQLSAPPSGKTRGAPNPSGPTRDRVGWP